MTEKIITYHIGGRSGSIGFPKIDQFKDETKHIIFDADESCIQQIKDQWDNADVYPYFIGNKNEEIKFNINYCPYTSSVYNFNNSYKDHFIEIGETDYVFGKVCETQKNINIKTDTLDNLHNKKLIPPANFLSIDTQGSEFEVLKGAENLIKNSILAINSEISFVNVYKDSTLFNEIDSFMKKNHFMMVDILGFNTGYKRIAKEFRGRGIPLQGEAMYFKDPKYIIRNNLNSSDLLLIKLSYIALAFGYTEFAYDTLLKVNNPENIKTKYSAFLNKFKIQIEQNKNLPKLWHNEVSFEESNNRFLKNSRINKKILSTSIILKIINKFFYFTKKLLKNLFIEINFNSPLSKFEKFLKKNNFDIAAQEIRKRRKSL